MTHFLSAGRVRFPRPCSTFIARAAALIIAGAAWVASGADPLFKEDFSAVPPGNPPDGFLVLDGQFAVKDVDGNRCLELPGSPLETFGIMFGKPQLEDWGAQARIRSTGQGRRFPVFGVSVNGVGGCRLQVAPARKALELLEGDEVRASVPFEWTSGSWTQLRIQIRKDGEGWKVEGKAWKDGTAEPEKWTITWAKTEAPISGPAAVWGKPFSGTPIQFDDLRVWAAEKK